MNIETTAYIEQKDYKGVTGLVSVIMATYNSELYVEDSIRSVLSQTYTQLELIITDDGSNDSTPQILKKWSAIDSRIKVILDTENKGAGASRNCSISAAQGQYIAFCDSDDRWMPNKLKMQVDFMQKNNVALCYAPYYTCDANSKLLGYIYAPKHVSLFSTMCDDKIGFLTAIYDTGILGKHLMPIQRKRQDYAHILFLLRNCREAYSVEEPLAYYRLHPNNISGKKFGLLKYNARTYNTVFGWPLALCYFFLIFFFLPSYCLKRIRNYIINLNFDPNNL